ncbi:hypothetical protein I307_01402 [Cryptococcus deuterogattii 99/473]|uniref:Uncharacterized protein n=1 Tax=Cryptococcus deuterogattii Ram5 TaxID=1296110 RepID=A0A0D0TUJ3_9TREE|nr:hypothetical protein I309_01562 [Cryptococcus deuterogattii LA55]KIR39523.1 hypothetical protein I313_04546 [Cryptococcus deuterogattii Ram5]KIR73858.1 hypothetical protein I310_02533 [Cryptococcus deuterogattii CA1014]KIR93350.1 hypothetical protein I304_03016 [Cryptococcus deuterogattii CBS 10090]KIR99387.1 hypothetical protein L804_03015 [Cryptococcus deuterogattii 2001/935-1]KIY59153.1 hypothetical protein I307_01402 [Cryptococcus deuterogattii 99/473]
MGTMPPLSKDRLIHPLLLSVLIPTSNLPRETHPLAILFLRRLVPALLDEILGRDMPEGGKEHLVRFRSHSRLPLLRLSYLPDLHPYPMFVQALP